MRAQEELKQLALEIVNGDVFTSDRIREGDLHLLSMIFLPLAFMNKEDQAQLQQDLASGEVVSLFGHIRNSCPRSINGYPILYEIETLSRGEAEIINDYINRYNEAVKAL